MSATAYDPGAETALLGGMMMSPTVIAACEDLNPTHFSQPHDLIFSAIAELHRTGKPILPRTVTTELQERGKLEAVGGAVYVSGLTYEGTTGAASAAYFVGVVRAKWEHRRAREIASHLHRVQQVVMIVPVDADEHEAQHIRQEHRHQRRERRDIGPVRHLHLQHHDRDDDGDHAIAERFQPSLAHSMLSHA